MALIDFGFQSLINYFDNNGDHGADMVKYLRQVSENFERSTALSWQTRNGIRTAFIFDLFSIEYGRCNSAGISKLVIMFDATHTGAIERRILLDVVIATVPIDVVTISSGSRFGQSNFFLSQIGMVFEAIGMEFGWDVERALQVIHSIRESGIEFDRPYQKPVYTKGRQRSAQLRIKFFERLELLLDVFDSDKELVRTIKVADLSPSIHVLPQTVGKISWDDSKSLRLAHANHRDYWIIETETGDVDFHFPRAESGDAHGQYALGCMYLNGDLVARNRDQARIWLGRAAAQGYKQAAQRLQGLED